MKKLMMMTAALLFVGFVAQAQHPQGPPKERPSVEQRTERTMGTLNKELSLSLEQLGTARTIFTDFFKEVDALMPANQGQRPEKEKVEALEKKRDEALLKSLTADQQAQYNKIKDQFRPQKEKPRNK